VRPSVLFLCNDGWCPPNWRTLDSFISHFNDDIVYKIKPPNVGCYCLSSVSVSLLFAPTVTGLLTLLAECEQKLLELDIKLNVVKSICIRFGEQFEAVCSDIVSAQGGNLQWVDAVRYLGVYFTSGRVICCFYHNAKCLFIR